MAGRSSRGEPLLRRSFIFLHMVGPATEKRIWSSGIHDWDAFLESGEVPGVGRDMKKEHDRVVRRAVRAMDRSDGAFLSDLLPTRESWRYYPDLGDGAVFLDIETTGLGRDSPVTVVGLYDGRREVSLIRGNDLSARSLRRELKDSRMLVTFNGAGFDLPMLERHFPGAVPRIPHLDLRFAAGRLGHRGGLKKIERQFGLSRSEDIQGMSGEDAVRLWHVWERDGNRNALRLLVNYNMADVVNLRELAGKVCAGLHRRLRREVPHLPSMSSPP